MDTSRRKIIFSLLGAAPAAILTPGLLMPMRTIVATTKKLYLQYGEHAWTTDDGGKGLAVHYAYSEFPQRFPGMELCQRHEIMQVLDVPTHVSVDHYDKKLALMIRDRFMPEKFSQGATRIIRHYLPYSEAA